MLSGEKRGIAYSLVRDPEKKIPITDDSSNVARQSLNERRLRVRLTQGMPLTLAMGPVSVCLGPSQSLSLVKK